MRIRCAILDDYQQVALKIADWSTITEKVEIVSFSQHFYDENELVDYIRDAEIVIVMRERTPFGVTLFEKLPKLKLLITSGMRNTSID
ncbi:MAG: D-2-hydroxyacid dehydrogenase family protein, partial [Psychrobacillus sp.]